MRHLNTLTKITHTPAPARSLLVWRAQLEVIAQALDVIEQALGILKGSGEE